MLIILLICCDSWLPQLWNVFNPYFFLCVFQGFLTALQLSLYCVSLYLFFASYVNGPSFNCVLSPSNLAITVFFCFDPVLPPLHQCSSHPVGSKMKCLLCLLSTVDSNLFSFPFIFLVHNKAGSKSCGKTSDFSEILPQPPFKFTLHLLLCMIVLVY